VNVAQPRDRPCASTVAPWLVVLISDRTFERLQTVRALLPRDALGPADARAVDADPQQPCRRHRGDYDGTA
jgi:hypothetical protein